MRISKQRFIHLVFTLILASVWQFQSSVAQAQSEAADAYLSGYLLVQDADKFMGDGEYEKAHRTYQDASKIFDTMAVRWPRFEPEMRDFRRKKINAAIAAIPADVRGFGKRPTMPETVGRPRRPTTGSPNSQLIAEKDEQIRYLENERKQLANQLAKTDRERISAIAGQVEAQKKTDYFVGQIAQMQKELTDAHNGGGTESAKLKDEIAKMQQEMAISKKGAEDAEKLATHLQEELDKASNYGQSLVAERKEVEEERERVNKLLAGSGDEKIKMLVAENERLRNDLKDARDEAGKLRAENSENKELIAKLRSKITTVEAELVKLQTENAAYRQQVSQLTAQLQDTDAKLDAMSKSKGGANEMLLKENGVLRNIIDKQLKSQSRRMQAKQLVVAELARLEMGSKDVLDLIDRMGDGGQLTDEEIETFAKSSGINPKLIDRGNPGKAPVYPTISNNEGQRSSIGLNEELTQFAKAAAYDFFNGNFNRCEASYEQILGIVPDNVHSLRNLAIVKIRLRKFEEAEQVLEKALAYGPDDDHSHFVLGVLHYRLQDSDSAMQAMERSLQLNPNNARAHFYVAVICMEPSEGGVGRRDPDRALSELKEVVKLQPEDGDAHFNLAILYIEAPQPDLLRARQHYRIARRNGSQSTPEMENRLGT